MDVMSAQVQFYVNSQVTFYPCKMSRGNDESACTAVLCQDCYDKKISGVVNDTDGEKKTDSRRKSRRTIGNCQSAPSETTYIADVNGCCHDDPNFFQPETNKIYYEDHYRKKNNGKNLNEKCLDCTKSMIDIVLGSSG